jgi:AcrR family transcriptional regulator
MDVAEAHLSKVGYMGVSLEEIAREVGVSKAALYYHFPEGKEEMFVEIGHRSLARVRKGLERAMSGAGDGAGKLRAVARWLMAERESGRPMSELRDMARFVDEGHRAELAESFYGDHYAPIRRVVAAAVESGEFREDDPDFLTWAFLGLASGMLDVGGVPESAASEAGSSASPRLSLSGDEAADRMVDLFLKGALQ